MVITLHGDDNARLSARLQALLAEHVPGELAALNLLELDGSVLSLPDLRAACDALPFLGDVRVVVVKGLLARFGEKDEDDSSAKSATAAFLKDLKAYLPTVPETTLLVFVERRKLGSSAAANALKNGTKAEEYVLPTGQDLPTYIAKLVKEKGATIDRDAAALLAEAVGDNPRRLEPELDKLLAFKAEDNHISARDVREMVDIPLEVAVWDLTDALYDHDSAAALRALKSLIECGQPPQQVMGAVASQFRNLVIAEEHRGGSADRLTSATGMKPFVARKSLGALRNFKPGEPKKMLLALTDLDLRAKTGKAELNSALEFLVVEACARRL